MGGERERREKGGGERGRLGGGLRTGRRPRPGAPLERLQPPLGLRRARLEPGQGPRVHQPAAARRDGAERRHDVHDT